MTAQIFYADSNNGNYCAMVGPGSGGVADYQFWGKYFVESLKLLPRKMISCQSMSYMSGGMNLNGAAGQTWYNKGSATYGTITLTTLPDTVKETLGDFHSHVFSSVGGKNGYTSVNSTKKMKQPSVTVALAESQNQGLVGLADSQIQYTGTGVIVLQHSGKANVAMADGHAESLSEGQVQESPMEFPFVASPLFLKKEI
jgi:prepilin-type processing-associated H-X9-DG protein